MSCPRYGPCDNPGNCKSCDHNRLSTRTAAEVQAKSDERYKRRMERRKMKKQYDSTKKE